MTTRSNPWCFDLNRIFRRAECSTIMKIRNLKFSITENNNLMVDILPGKCWWSFWIHHLIYIHGISLHWDRTNSNINLHLEHFSTCWQRKFKQKLETFRESLTCSRIQWIPFLFLSWLLLILRHFSFKISFPLLVNTDDWLSVTYWPSTELSIKKCTSVNNRCIWSKTSGYHLELWTGWIWCNCDAPRKQVDVKQLYNLVPQTVWVSWSQLQLEFESLFEAVRTSSRQRACSPQWPPVEQPSRMRKKCCYSQRNLGSICCSLFHLQLTSHTQPFRNPFENKVWEVYFSKEVCSFVIIVDYVSTYICIPIVVSWLYNIRAKCSLKGT